VRFPILSKALALGAVSMGLMWSLWSVQSVVQERQQRQAEAERSVANSLAGEQTLLGPVLLRQCTETWVSGQTEGPNPKLVTETRSFEVRLPPAQLRLDGQVEMTPRYRGMFKVNGYALKSQVTAQWADLSALSVQAAHPSGKVECRAPVLSVALSDGRGIRVAELLLDGKPAAVQPGSGQDDHPRGFQTSLSEAWIKPGQPLAVGLHLELAGTRTLSVAPVADNTYVKLHADWPHPSFGGRFLPSERDVQASGFDATWKVTSLASTARQQFVKGRALCPVLASGDPDSRGDTASADSERGCIESFGIDFIDPINPYVLSDRATKYGLLFIVLTFVGVGLTEVLRRLRVHPIQYLLVGAALSVFFLLLVSLSEHMLFMWAYVAASLACTFLLTFYGSFVLRGWRAGLGFGAGIAGLFGTLYALLQMEQSALVLGSLLLFAVLAVVMISTRKLDWYALMNQIRSDVASEPQRPSDGGKVQANDNGAPAGERWPGDPEAT
jgi:inner membrane protein